MFNVYTVNTTHALIIYSRCWSYLCIQTFGTRVNVKKGQFYLRFLMPPKSKICEQIICEKCLKLQTLVVGCFSIILFSLETIQACIISGSLSFCWLNKLYVHFTIYSTLIINISCFFRGCSDLSNSMEFFLMLLHITKSSCFFFSLSKDVCMQGP